MATDVDGTLTTMDGKLSCKAVEAVRMLEAKNIPVILVSGNALCVLKTLKTYIGCSGAIVAESGAVVEYKGKIEILGDGGKVREALKRLKEKFGEHFKERWSNMYRYVDAALDRNLKYEEVSKVLEEFPELLFLDSGFAYHITVKGLDKGVGLTVAAKLMGLNVEDFACVGDSDVDVAMFKVSGFKIALANSSKELKLLANYVTLKSGGEGFAEAAEKILFMLGKGGNVNED